MCSRRACRRRSASSIPRLARERAGLGPQALQGLMSASLIHSAQATIYIDRTRGHGWSSPPSATAGFSLLSPQVPWMVFAAALGAVLVATLALGAAKP